MILGNTISNFSISRKAMIHFGGCSINYLTIFCNRLMSTGLNYLFSVFSSTISNTLSLMWGTTLDLGIIKFSGSLRGTNSEDDIFRPFC